MIPARKRVLGLLTFTAVAIPAFAIIGYTLVAWMIREFESFADGLGDIESDWDCYDYLVGWREE